jgi:hypothetical protein
MGSGACVGLSPGPSWCPRYFHLASVVSSPAGQRLGFVFSTRWQLTLNQCRRCVAWRCSLAGGADVPIVSLL